MGGVFKISTVAMSNLCGVYRENLETFEKIMRIEELMYPVVSRESAKANTDHEEIRGTPPTRKRRPSSR